MRFGLAAFTTEGQNLLEQVQEVCATESFVVFDKGKASAREWIAQIFSSCDAFVFVGAVGIAVRLIAPHITAKDKDPAVVVLDEKGRFVIPLLSGHLGGANALAEKLARGLNAEAVITTSTDVHNVFAVDVWSREQHCAIEDISKIKYVSARLLNNESIGFFSDFPVEGSLPQGLVGVLPHELPEGILTETVKDPPSGTSQLSTETSSTVTGRRPASAAPNADTAEKNNGRPAVGICLSLQTNRTPFATTLHVVPQIVIAGVGCRKGVTSQAFESFIIETLERHALSINSLKALASIDLKKHEPCFLDFCAQYGLEFLTFSGEKLNNVTGDFSASAFVQSVTGVDNVCERAAFAAGGSQLILSKTSCDGMTLALAVPAWNCRFF